ncbi:glycerophosphodiester phosphodiesterase family protein [Roseibacterium sp. SDUM158017]|uniref:glycerophosphodiester phosphodiesterase family protein n=1 Tax=Roseicyclus salinarum TaxID=3036773 RepID=UPI002415098A|nr:glycerophosphodiester phosphodiesterase family protein [Roseibacterium sp. SDUM158017]MDG4648961.1 glycerophosphodiester phosphodiesterase family protein [Roseibacterium sp. SDUM158017]
MRMILPPAFLDTPIAHRGLHDAANGIPENSRSAVRRAAGAGYGVEIDVQLSSDGRAIVFHDDTLERLTHASGPVNGRTARDLSDLVLRDSEDRVPTLADILALVAGRVPLLVEIKDQSGALAEGPGGLERAVAADLSGYGGPVAVMSFNPFVVAAMKDIAPELPRGLVTCGFIPSQWPRLSAERCAALRSIAAFGKAGARFISHDRTDLGSPRVADLKAQGVPVLCWTVRSPQVEAEARRVADNITFEGYLPDVPGQDPARWAGIDLGPGRTT